MLLEELHIVRISLSVLLPLDLFTPDAEDCSLDAVCGERVLFLQPDVFAN